MMHVTPMWIPMMMPVVEVLLFCSSFMQSQGGFSTARRKGERGVSSAVFLLLLQLLGSPRAKVGAWVVLGAVYEEEESRVGSQGGHCLPKQLPCSWYCSCKHRTRRSIESQPHYPGCCYWKQLTNKKRL